MKTLSRNIKNDIYIEKGGLALSEDAEAKCDIIESIVLTQQGELQFDPEGGVDYFGSVFQSAQYIDLWAAQVRTIIEALDWVQSVENFEYRFDAPTSSLYWSMEVLSVDGERLDIKDKKRKSDDTLDVKIKWDTIYNKENVDTARKSMAKMIAARNSAPYGDKDGLANNATLQNLKNGVNDIILLPNGSGDHDASDDIRVYLAGMDKNQTVKFSNVKADGEWTVYWGDGTVNHYDQATAETDGHVYSAGGDATVIFVGGIEQIGADQSVRAVERSTSSFVNVPRRVIGFSAGSETILKKLGADTFCGCSSLVAVAIGAEVTTIGDHCFDGCSALSDLKWIPSTVSSIGEYAFTGCSSLVSLEGLQGTECQQIPTGCFKDCVRLRSAVHFPSIVGIIGESAFEGCTSITTVFIRDGVYEIGDKAFPTDSIVNVRWDAPVEATIDFGYNFPQRKKTLHLYVPEGNVSLFVDDWDKDSLLVHGYGDLLLSHSVVGLPRVRVGETSNIVSACVWTVDNGDGTEEVLLPWENTIPSHVYAEVEEYLNVQIFGYLTRIEAAGTNAFPIVSFGDKGTNKWLTSVIISEGMSDTLDAIGTACFCGCSALEEVAAPNTVVVGGEMAFFGCDSLQSVAFVKDFEAGASDCFSNCNGLGSGMWSGASSSSITNIPAGCFQNCDNITLDGAPNSITSIGEYAFSESGIETLEGFPSGVTEVGVGCFLLCDKLTDISRLDNATGLKCLPELCFSDCTKLTSLKGTANITYIGEECFYNCGITSLEGLLSTVPNSQNDWLEIDDSAFAYTKVKDTSFLPMATKKMGAFVFDGTEMSRVVITSTVPAAITPETFAGIYSTADDEDRVPIYVRPGFLQVYKSAPVWSSLNLRENGITFYVIAGTPNGGNNIGSISLGSSQDITVIWGVMGKVAVASPTNNIVSTGDGYVTPSVNEPVTVMGDVTTIESFTTSAALVSISCARHLPLTSIAANCFKDCTNLVYAGLSFADNSNSDNNSATTIGASAFQGCDNLVEVDIRDTENSPQAIGNFAFSGCESLIRIGYGGGGQDEYAAAELANLQTIGDNAFAGCVALGTFPKLPSVTSIGENAFEGCTALVDINGIGNAIGIIKATAFTGCYNIASVTMTKGTAPTLADSGFDDDTYASAFLYVPAKSLEAYRKAEGWKKFYRNHILPHGITFRLESAATMEVAGDTGFVDADGEWTIDWGDGKVETLEGSAYIPAHSYEGVDSTRYVTLKGHITQIRSAAESAPFLAEANATTHTHLTAFYASHDMGLEAIGARAFYGCTNLAEVLLAGNTVVSLGQYAFYGCTALTTENIVGLEAVQEIPPYGFAGCTEIMTLDFMPYIAEVGNGGFYGCTGLVEANTLPLETISPFAFCNCSSLLRTPDCVSNYGGDSESDSSVLGEGDETIEPYSITIGGGAFSGCSSLAELGTMDAVTEIGNNAFGGCVALNDLRELANVTTINPNAFKGCTGLTSLAVFENVTTIGDEAFRGCTRLTSLLGLGNVNSIGEYAFAECENIESISDLGAGIVRIGDFAFLGVGGDTEKFPEIRMKAVTPPVIGEHTFASMDKSAVKVYVPLPSVADYRNDMLWGGRPINYWSEFANIDAAQTLRFKLTNIPEKGLTVSGRNAQIVIEPLNTASPVYDPTTGQTIVVMNTYSQWFVDWGDGSQVEEYDAAQTAMPSHRYSGEFSEAVITISGNVKEIGTVSDSLPFLFDENATAEEGNPIEFPYLVGFTVPDDVPLDGIGANCFVNCTELSDIILSQKGGEGETARSDDEDVFEIGDYAFANTGVTSLKFLLANTRLNDGVFANCKKLVSLEGWPASLTVIPAYTFYNCTALTELNIGVGGEIPVLEAVEEFAFAVPTETTGEYASAILFATFLTEVAEIPEIASTSFASKDSDFVKSPSLLEVSTSQEEAFVASDWHKAFTMVSDLGATQFSLVGMNAEKGTTIIHQATSTPFSACVIDWGDGSRSHYMLNGSRIEHKYSVSDAIVTIYAGACTPTGALEVSSESYGWGYVLVTEVTMGGEVLYTKGYDKGGCPYLVSVDMEEGNSGWIGLGDGYLRKCENLESVTVASSVKSIGAHCFDGCLRLSSLSGFTSVTTLGESAFHLCKALSSTSVFTEVTSIPTECFKSCTGLTTLDGLNKVTEIKSEAFLGCVNLADTNGLGSSLSSIEEKAFAGVKINGSYGIAFAGTRLVINSETPPTIDSHAFGEKIPYSRPVLVVPGGTKSAYQESTWGSIFTYIEDGSSTEPIEPSAVLVIEIPDPNNQTSALLQATPRASRRDGGYLVTYTGPNIITSWGDGDLVPGETTHPVTNDQGTAPSDSSFSGDSSADSGSNSALGENETSSDFSGSSEEGSSVENINSSDYMSSDCVSSDYGGSSSYGEDSVESIESVADWDSSSVPIDESTFSTESSVSEDSSGPFDSSVSEDDSAISRTYDWLRRDTTSTLPYHAYATPGVYYIRITPSSDTDTTLEGTWTFPANTRVLQLRIEPSCLFTSIDEGYCKAFKDEGGQTVETAFKYLETVSIENNLQEIKPEAFQACALMTELFLPRSLNTIACRAFKGCASLTSISLDLSGTPVIGEAAFKNCSGLLAVAIPMSIGSIYGDSSTSQYVEAEAVFAGCNALTRLDIGEKILACGVGRIFPTLKGSNTEKVFVAMDDAVTTIPQAAFDGLSRIGQVGLPNALTTIGQWAFRDCLGLEAISIPDSVTNFESDPFLRCSGLQEISVGANVLSFVEDNPNGLSRIFGSGSTEAPYPVKMATLRSVSAIPPCCFLNWRNLETVQGRKQKGATGDIGNDAFNGCKKLVNLEIKAATNNRPYIGDGVYLECNAIGERAFSGCESMTALDVRLSAEQAIGERAFSGCSSLKEVKLNRHLNGNLEGLSHTAKIGQHVFSGCPTDIWEETSEELAGLKILGRWVFGAFSSCALTTLDLVNGRVQGNNGEWLRVRGIAPAAFNDDDCPLRTNVTAIRMGFSGSYPSLYDRQALGSWAFLNFSALTEISLDDYVHPITDIEWSVTTTPFTYCSNIDTVTLGRYACAVPLSELLPGEFVEDGNSNLINQTLVSVDLTPGVTVETISPNAFEGCNAITRVGANQYVASTGLHAVFPDSNITFCRFRDDVTELSSGFLMDSNCSHFGMSGLATSRLSSGREILKNKMKELTLYEDETTPGRCQVAREAFRGFSALETVHVSPAGTQMSLGAYAFAQSGIKSIEWLIASNYPAETTAIGDYAFFECTALTNTAKAKMTTIPAYCFNGCTNITAVPNVGSVREIKEHAFEGCVQLKSFSAPKLSNIKDSAFAGCTALKALSNMSSLDEVGKEAFKGAGISSISGLKYLGVVGDNAFEGTACTTIFKGLLMPARLGKAIFKNAKSSTVYAPTDTFFVQGGLSPIIANELNSPFPYPSPDFKPIHCTDDRNASMRIVYPQSKVSAFFNNRNRQGMNTINHPGSTIPYLFKLYFQSVGFSGFSMSSY